LVSSSKLWPNFRDANEALRGLRVDYWIDCGTLLGAIREGDLLAHDQDVDFGVLGTDQHQKILRWMQALGFRLYRAFGTVDRGYEQSFIRNGAKVDIFYFYPDEDKLWCGTWWRKGKHLIVNEFPDHFTPPQKFDLLGEPTFVPADPERVLECRYGDWKTVQKQWRWYRDPPCIRPDTLPPLAEMEAHEKRKRG
jgi:fukutin